MAIDGFIITVSDRRAAGEGPDVSGDRAAELLADHDITVRHRRVVHDETTALTVTLHAALETGVRLVLTTGGTGISPSDHTPEATRSLLDYELPGLAEAIRRAGEQHHRAAVLSRGLVGVAGNSLLVNAPGSPDGVATAIGVIAPLLGHILDQLDGKDHGHDDDDISVQEPDEQAGPR